MDVGSNDLGRNLPKIPSKFFLFGKVPISKWLVLNSADGQVYETDGQGITQRWGSLAEYLQYELVEDQKYRERFEK
jgi:hypothetical protein